MICVDPFTSCRCHRYRELLGQRAEQPSSLPAGNPLLHGQKWPNVQLWIPNLQRRGTSVSCWISACKAFQSGSSDVTEQIYLPPLWVSKWHQHLFGQLDQHLQGHSSSNSGMVLKAGGEEEPIFFYYSMGKGCPKTHRRF